MILKILGLDLRGNNVILLLLVIKVMAPKNVAIEMDGMWVRCPEDLLACVQKQNFAPEIKM